MGVLHGSVLDDRAVAPDLEVALLGVDDHVEILIRLVLLFCSAWRKNVSSTPIIVGLSMFFRLLRILRSCWIRFRLSILRLSYF